MGPVTEESKNRVAKLTNTHAEGARRQVGILPHTVHKEWMFTVYIQADDGAKSR